MQPGVGVLPGWWSQADPQQRQSYVQRQTTQNERGVYPAWWDRASKEQQDAYIERQTKGTEDIPLSPSATEAYDEAMDTRIDKARNATDTFLKPRFGSMNLDEKHLFKEWQKYTGMYKFRNDTQRRAMLNIWKNKIANEGKGESNVDWTDPKWEEAIGLAPSAMPVGARTARKADSTGPPANQAAFEEIVRSMKDPAERQKYYDKHKTQWPGEYE
jgi:hypothetical protein